MTFEEILKSMLADLDNGKSAEEIVAAKSAELGLSQEAQANVKETVDCVKRLSHEEQSLKDAKEKGCSATQWLEYRIDSYKEALPKEMQPKADEILKQLGGRMIESMTQNMEEE